MACDDIKPCADCPWTLLLLTGQPIFIMYCETCKHWYQAASANLEFPAFGPNSCTVLAYGPKEHITSLLHCDALASKIFIQRRRYCGYCDILLRTTTTFYSNPTNLETIIMTLTPSSYRNSTFPAYTFLHRCGAHPPFIDAILKVRPDQAAKVAKHLANRQLAQQRFMKKVLPLIASRQKKENKDLSDD